MAWVRDILAKKGSDVAVIAQDATVLEATQRMNDRRVGALVVTNVGGDRVVGIFTERDVLRRVVAAGRDPKTTRVADVMSTPVACCQPDTELAECRAVMTENRIRHLPVVKDGRLVGIISIGDIVAREQAEHLNTIRWLNEYLYGPVP